MDYINYGKHLKSLHWGEIDELKAPAEYEA